MSAKNDSQLSDAGPGERRTCMEEKKITRRLALDEVVRDVLVSPELMAEAVLLDRSPWDLKRVSARGLLARKYPECSRNPQADAARLLAGETTFTPGAKVRDWVCSMSATTQARLRADYERLLFRYVDEAEVRRLDRLVLVFLEDLLHVVIHTYAREEMAAAWARLESLQQKGLGEHG